MCLYRDQHFQILVKTGGTYFTKAVMADDRRCFGALLNGLARRNYFGNSELTDELLKEQIYPKISDEEFQQLVTKCTALTKSMVSVDMDFNQLEAFLTSQIRKKDSGMNEEKSNAVRKFWKNHRTKIHETQVQQTMWDTSLKQMSWRVDIKTQSKNNDHVNAPTAIIELQLSDNQETLNGNEKPELLHFEMDEKKLDHFLKSLYEIRDEISLHSKDQH